MDERDIYDPQFIEGLFDEMSKSYGLTNLISSFGFCLIWRRQCVGQVRIERGAAVCDLMSGMGECWRAVAGQTPECRLVALDFSAEMCRRARGNAARLESLAVAILEEDVLSNSIEDESADCVISTFGLKTFSGAQREALAGEIARILKPSGVFSLLEISVPANRVLRLPYMFYLRRVVPLLGRLFLGNPDNYRMLGVYTEQFGDCRATGEMLRRAGLEVRHLSYFFGCATGLVGRKP